MPVPVESLDTPLEPITLPRGGRTLPARDFTLATQKLAARAEAGDVEAAREVLRRCVPGITDDEMDDLSTGEVQWIVAYCARRLEEVTALLKNAAGAAAATATSAQASAPTTSTSTPSPASGASKASTGGTSRRARSTASSSLSTA